MSWKIADANTVILGPTLNSCWHMLLISTSYLLKLLLLPDIWKHKNPIDISSKWAGSQSWTQNSRLNTSVYDVIEAGHIIRQAISRRDFPGFESEIAFPLVCLERNIFFLIWAIETSDSSIMNLRKNKVIKKNSHSNIIRAVSTHCRYEKRE